MSFCPGTVILCWYIKNNGIICRGPALRNHRFCYFHQRWHDQRMVPDMWLRRRARALART